MKLVKTYQLPEDSYKEKSYDCIICSSGFEERARFLPSMLELESIPLKYAICFKNYTNERSRLANDQFFKANGFVLIENDADEPSFFDLIWTNITSDCNKSEINIVVDYSAMTRLWYSSIISYLNNIASGPNVNLYFFYSFSKFAPPVNSGVRNIHIGPINGFSSLSIPDKPTALIIGLGYEKERAFGLTEYLDAETYLFIADHTKGMEYFKQVEKANEEIINFIKPENKFDYSLTRLENAESLLFSVCKSLNTDYRLILAPTGPKPFTLLCLLVATRLDNIDVWRISAGSNSQPFNKVADSTLNCYVAAFSTQLDS